MAREYEYPGDALSQERFNVWDPGPNYSATVAHTGISNAWMIIVSWLPHVSIHGNPHLGQADQGVLGRGHWPAWIQRIRRHQGTILPVLPGLMGKNDRSASNNVSMARVGDIAPGQDRDAGLSRFSAPSSQHESCLQPLKQLGNNSDAASLGSCRPMVLVEGDKAFLKVSKAFAEMEAENVLLRK